MRNLKDLWITIQNENEAELIIKKVTNLKVLNGIEVNRNVLQLSQEFDSSLTNSVQMFKPDSKESLRQRFPEET